MNLMNEWSNILKEGISKRIHQNLQSLIISKEQRVEYSIKKHVEKNNSGIEIIPVKKQPLIFQIIERINYKSRIKPVNKIQELTEFKILSFIGSKLPQKRKAKIKFFALNIDILYIYYIFLLKIWWKNNNYAHFKWWNYLHPLVCKKSNNFSKKEELIYDKYSEYEYYNIVFIANGNIIILLFVEIILTIPVIIFIWTNIKIDSKNKSLENYKIKNNDHNFQNWLIKFN